MNGVGVGEITPQIRDQLQLPPKVKGALVTNVDPDSPSAKQGLREGDIILELDKKLVSNAEEAVKLSEDFEGAQVLLRVWTRGAKKYIVVNVDRGEEPKTQERDREPEEER